MCKALLGVERNYMPWKSYSIQPVRLAGAGRIHVGLYSKRDPPRGGSTCIWMEGTWENSLRMYNWTPCRRLGDATDVLLEDDPRLSALFEVTSTEEICLAQQQASSQGQAVFDDSPYSPVFAYSLSIMVLSISWDNVIVYRMNNGPGTCPSLDHLWVVAISQLRLSVALHWVPLLFMHNPASSSLIDSDHSHCSWERLGLG